MPEVEGEGGGRCMERYCWRKGGDADLDVDVVVLVWGWFIVLDLGTDLGTDFVLDLDPPFPPFPPPPPPPPRPPPPSFNPNSYLYEESCVNNEDRPATFQLNTRQ